MTDDCRRIKPKYAVQYMLSYAVTSQFIHLKSDQQCSLKIGSKTTFNVITLMKKIHTDKYLIKRREKMKWLIYTLENGKTCLNVMYMSKTVSSHVH